MSQTPMYVIPARYRRMENMHIVFWLFKDISWCMIWKELGIAMVFPTLIVAIVIAWRTRNMKSELAHNLAITFWIAANSYWMISEFFGFDSIQIFNSYSGKHLALIPFVTGIGILANYYLFSEERKNRRKTNGYHVAIRPQILKLDYNSALITLFFDKGS